MNEYSAYIISVALTVVGGLVRSAFLTRLSLFYTLYFFFVTSCLNVLWNMSTTRIIQFKQGRAIKASCLYCGAMGTLEMLLWDDVASLSRLAESTLCTILPTVVVFYTLNRVINRVSTSTSNLERSQ